MWSWDSCCKVQVAVVYSHNRTVLQIMCYLVQSNCGQAVQNTSYRKQTHWDKRSKFTRHILLCVQPWKKGLSALPCVVQRAELSRNSLTVSPRGYTNSISSKHDSCIPALIGQFLRGVPDLSDGAHVARFGWLVYILSNMRLWGTEKTHLFRKSVKQQWQVLAGTALWYYFWGILAEVDTCLAVDRKKLWFACRVACSNKQHSTRLVEIRRSEEVGWKKGVAAASKSKVRRSGPGKSMCVLNEANYQTEGGGVAQDIPMPAIAPIRKFITLLIIPCLWFMVPTTGSHFITFDLWRWESCLTLPRDEAETSQAKNKFVTGAHLCI